MNGKGKAIIVGVACLLVAGALTTPAAAAGTKAPKVIQAQAVVLPTLSETAVHEFGGSSAVEVTLSGVSKALKGLHVALNGEEAWGNDAIACSYGPAKAIPAGCAVDYTWDTTSGGEQTILVKAGGRTLAGKVTATAPAPDPVRVQFQLVYLYPAGTKPVAGRIEKMTITTQLVQLWFSGQMAGLSPRFATDASGRPSVVSVQAPLDSASLAAEEDYADVLIPTWRATGVIPVDSFPIIFVEGTQTKDGCGWSGRTGPDQHITIPMGNCEIYPTAERFPYGSSYLLAHEITHSLGGASDNAPHSDGTAHVTDDPRDVIFNGDVDRDWDHLTLDPGHDDYYLTGRTDLENIETSPLLQVGAGVAESAAFAKSLAFAQAKLDWKNTGVKFQTGQCRAYRINPAQTVSGWVAAPLGPPSPPTAYTLTKAELRRVYKALFRWACSGPGTTPR